MYEAVIFDFDGVIADTMADNCLAWQEAFAAYGLQISSDEYFLLEGMGRYQIAQHFIDKYKLDPAIESAVVKAKELNFKNRHQFRLYPEVPAILNLLSNKKIPVAIVTGASKERIERDLQPEIREQLTALVTADDVTHTKPHPEPYLKAIKKLAKPAGTCLVIENAILGIEAAKAAGCKCFALETTLQRKNLTQADEVFAQHSELLTRLEMLF
jgi:beta-phosphoglucomutase